jgi:3-hydroxyethyl bacteriochlorophyllide a dehydrogenase
MSLSVSSPSSDHAETSSNIADTACGPAMITQAVMFAGEKRVSVEDLNLKQPDDDDLVVDVLWSGVSTGTERLLWSGEMPLFPGLNYPLVPGYEAVGVVSQSNGHPSRVGESVFVPGAHCFETASSVFGASAARLVVPADRAVALPGSAAAEDVLLALAATAHHAVTKADLPELIVGHGTLGRLMARIVMALGSDVVTVWETDSGRAESDQYTVLHPDKDSRADYRCICDASGSMDALDTAVSRASRGADIVLAGFYAGRVSFDFAPAFMRELTFAIAAEWTPGDMAAVQNLRAKGLLSFDGLVTHTERSIDAEAAYTKAFTQSECLKMVLDWRGQNGHAH